MNQASYLIYEDGPNAGKSFHISSDIEQHIGRDPDICSIVLEDPMVSRNHARIFFHNEEFYLENKSAINQTYVNGEEIADPTPLREGDVIQIGNQFFRFSRHTSEISIQQEDESQENGDVSESEKSQVSSTEENTSKNHQKDLPSTHQYSSENMDSIFTQNMQESLLFTLPQNIRWIMKVVAGPNQGAEFVLQANKTYSIGKDLSNDIVLQDLSVSHRHATLMLSSSGLATITDLESRNGVVVNGMKIDGPTSLPSQSFIALGSTTLVFIDNEASEQTLSYDLQNLHKESAGEDKDEQGSFSSSSDSEQLSSATHREWKNLIIPSKHLIIGLLFCFGIFTGFISIISLFKTPLAQHDNNSQEIKKMLEKNLAAFPSVQFSFNPSSKQLFLTGHLLTETDHNILLHSISYPQEVKKIDDNITIDEKTWKEMNALILTNPNWKGISVIATKPGNFIVRGYLPTEEEASALQAFIETHFPYLHLLKNHVFVENLLHAQISNILIKNGFANINLQLTSGDLLIKGQINKKEKERFHRVVQEIEKTPGIRNINNLVLYTEETNQYIDMSEKYKVMGSSKFGEINQYVLVNGKILTIGDVLDGMTITQITQNEIFLEKGATKYRIDYNHQ